LIEFEGMYTMWKAFGSSLLNNIWWPSMYYSMVVHSFVMVYQCALCKRIIYMLIEFLNGSVLHIVMVSGAQLLLTKL
jgi:hypothetical protein